MTQNRRTVLTGLGLGAAALGASAVATAQTSKSKAKAPVVKKTGQGRMKNITITQIMTDAGPGLGVRTPRGVLDVAGVERDNPKGLPTTANDVIMGIGDLKALAELVANNAAKAPAKRLIAEDKVKFAPIVDNPPKIICVGLNYAAHAAESGGAPPKEPILFNKYNTALNNHNGTIKVTGEPSNQWDYEAELVMVLSKGGRNIPEDKALDYVFGYASGNDFSNRDLQRRSAQWMLGKTTDGSGPFGPWLVSQDQVDVNNLEMKMIVNGEVRQSTNTKLMIFNCAQIIAYCSKYFSLTAGDVIFTGTCDGIIGAMPPNKRVWLKPGDEMVTTITGLGDLHVKLV